VRALEDRCLLSAGYLDPTFGTAGAGVVTTAIGAINNSDNNEIGQRVLIQPDGKLLAFGTSSARYNTDGSLDTSFGSGGIANFSGNSAALLSNGQILLSGGGGTSGFSLERLNSNGTLDTTFGTQGVVHTAFANSTGEPLIVVQADGKIVLASDGWTVKSGRYVPYLDLARYNADGSLDTSFGHSGTVATSFKSSSSGEIFGVQSLLLQANDELVVVADVDVPVGATGLLVARYNTNGSLDTSFGNQGSVTASWCGHVAGAVLYPTTGSANDGKIAVVGYNTSLSEYVLARFNTNGSLDTPFGSSGFAPLSLGMEPFGVAFDSSGRFVVVGSFALERLNADGTPDTTFGSGGVVTTGLSDAHGDGLAIYPSTGTDTADYGKIALVGGVGGAGGVTGNGFMVARFLPSAPASAPNFVVSAPPSVTAGVSFSVSVTATDANGNVLTGYTGTVDFADLAVLDPQASLPANYTFTPADQGVHTFTATFYKATTEALFVADTATPGMNGRDLGIQVNPGAVATFVLQPDTSSPRAGTAFGIYAQAVDAYGNATSTTDTVHFSSSDPKATLPADETYPGNGTLLGTFTLRTRGTQTITVTDVNNPLLSVTFTFQVS
jgi:uncharacterized delta-60 repeat protein